MLVIYLTKGCEVTKSVVVFFLIHSFLLIFPSNFSITEICFFFRFTWNLVYSALINEVSINSRVALVSFVLPLEYVL